MGPSTTRDLLARHIQNVSGLRRQLKRSLASEDRNTVKDQHREKLLIHLREVVIPNTQQDLRREEDLSKRRRSGGFVKEAGVDLNVAAT